MRAALGPLASLVGLTLSGCSTIAGGPPRVAAMLPTTSADGKIMSGTGDVRLASLAETINVDCYLIPRAADAVTPLPSAKLRRNRLAKVYLLRADEAYYQYESALLNDNRQLNFLATIASLGLATAGSAASGHTARILSAANAGVIGERAAFTKEYLFDKTIAALQNQMRANRSAVATRIYEGLSRPGDEYTTCDALRDLLAYEQAGTLAEGLTGIADTTAARAGAEKQAEEAAKQLTYADSPLAQALQEYFGPADEKVMRARIADAIKSMAMVDLIPPPDLSPQDYFGRILVGQEYEREQRALALAVLMKETDTAARTPIVDALK